MSLNIVFTFQDVYPFKYILTEPVKKNNSKSGEKEKLKMDEFTEAKKDFITSWISKLGKYNFLVNIMDMMSLI